ncbi:MAG: hypothetical protein ACR5LD_07940 [Symbiopectobacterium sp.]
MPVAFMAGNGAGVTGVYVLVGTLLLIFSFGFIAMSRYYMVEFVFSTPISHKGWLGTHSGIAELRA